MSLLHIDWWWLPSHLWQLDRLRHSFARCPFLMHLKHLPNFCMIFFRFSKSTTFLQSSWGWFPLQNAHSNVFFFMNNALAIVTSGFLLTSDDEWLFLEEWISLSSTSFKSACKNCSTFQSSHSSFPLVITSLMFSGNFFIRLVRQYRNKAQSRFPMLLEL